MRFRLSLKWKIFTMLAVLGLCSQAFDLWHSEQLITQATSNTENGVKAILHHYLSFQQAVSQGYAAAVDVWADSVRLREALQHPEVPEQLHQLGQTREAIREALHPDLIVLIDKNGTAHSEANTPIGQAEIRQLKVFTDLRVGQVIRNQILEHRDVAYVVSGAPVEAGGQVVGGLLLGVRVEALMRDFKAQNEEAGQRRLELALVHNTKVTAATLDGDSRLPLPDAVRQERRETIQEGGRKVSVVALPEGRYEFQMQSLSGYEGAVSTFIGGLYVMRSRIDKEQRIRALILSSYQVVMASVLIALLAAALLTWIVMRPIRALIAATAEIARGQGDLTRRLPVTSDDELGRLAGNLNELFDNLYRLARGVSSASQQVETSSGEISAVSKQMLVGAKDQAHKIVSSTNAITELSASIQQVAANAMQATKVARESGAQVQVAIDCMDRIRSAVEEAADRIGDLGESGKRIGNIVEVIRQISEQTSLLALNASIEAAHAGEQGRGFAVVADEVSSLARRVGQSAEDIEELIGTIRDQTAESVRSMQNGTREVEGGTQVVTQTLGSLRKIVEVVQETAKAVHEQAVVSDDIARTMDEVREITKDVVGKLEEAVSSGDLLHHLALKLEESVSGFNVGTPGRERELPPAREVREGRVPAELLQEAARRAESERRQLGRG